MSLGIECLLAESEAEAAPMVFELDNLNQYRREIEQDMVADALKQVMTHETLLQGDRPNTLCLYHEDWHQGVVGLVASRIKEKLNRPVIAFARENEQQIKGSGRSVPGVHMRDVLANIAAKKPYLLAKFGGHAMAAGLTIELQHLDEFRQAFDAEVNRWLGAGSFDDTVLSDGALAEHELNLDTALRLKKLGPWGQAFPEPLFDGVFDVVQKRILADRHIKLVLRQAQSNTPIDAILFFANDELLLQSFERVEIVYKVDINEYRGESNLQLLIEQLTVV
jgi:single-stranded-DNA-specific exonuclease